MTICLNGQFLSDAEAKISVLDNGFLYGDGFYDTMRTYDGSILELELHLDRIEKSAKLTGIPLPCSRTQLREWIQETIRLNGFAAARVRVTLTRGVNGFDFLTCKTPTLVITCEALVVNPSDYTQGVSAYTMKLKRVFPEIKTLGLTVMMLAYRDILPKKGYEALLVDDSNCVREGASTNLFLVKDGVLKTPKDNMLPGLTRARVIELARAEGLTVVEGDVAVAELAEADEVFLTNRPREIIPVVMIDEKKVGEGQIGPVTTRVMKMYQDYITSEMARQKK